MAAEIVVTAQPKTAAHMVLHGILAAIWGRCHHILPQLTQDTRWRSRYDEYFVRFAFDCIAATSMRMPLPNANGCEPSSRKLHRVSVSSKATTGYRPVTPSYHQLTGGALGGTQRTCWRSCGRATRSPADGPRSRTSCEASTTVRPCLRRRSCRSQSISCAHPSPRRSARHPHRPRWPHRAPRRYPCAGGARSVSCLRYAGGRTGSHSAHTLHSADLKISSCSSRSIAMASSSPSCSCVVAAIAGASSASINARCGNPRTSEVFPRAGAYRAPRACHRDGERILPWCACCRAQRRGPRCMAHAAVRRGYPAAVESLETVEFPYRLRSPPLRSRPP